MKDLFENIPTDFVSKWQGITDLIAKIVNVPAVLIMKVENNFMKVLIASKSDNNPYHPGDKENWHGLYCETVIKSQKKLKVPNALKDELWKNNPDIKLGMISYLGFPINFPDRKPFGTICILSDKESHFSKEAEELLIQFKNVIELDLAIIYSLEAPKDLHETELVDKLMERNKRLMKTDEKLIKANERFKLAVDGSNDGIWDWDLEKNKLYLSMHWKQQLGYADDEVPNEFASFESRIHPDDKGYVLEYLEKYFQYPDEKYDIEFRMHHKNGTYRWIRARGAALRRSDGTPYRMAGSHTDITDQKEARKALSDSEEKYKLLSENAKDGIALFEDNTLKYISQGFLDILGYSMSDIGPMSLERVLTFYHPDDVMPYVAKMKEAISNKMPKYDMRYRMRTKKGDYVWLENSVKAEFDSNGKHIRSIIQTREITDKIKLEEELKSSEAKYRMLTENITDVIWVMNLEKKSFTYISPSVVNLTGFTVEEAMQQSIEESLAPESAEFIVNSMPLIVKEFQENPATKIIRHSELRQICKNGEYKWIDAVIQLQYSQEGELEIIGVSRDIDDQKKAKEQLKESHQLLKNLTQHVPGALYQYRYHPDGRSYFPYSSENICNIYDVTPEEVRNDAAKVFSRIHPDDENMVVDSINKSYESLSVWDLKYRVVLPKKGERWVHGIAKPEKLEDDSVLWHGYLWDITEKQENDRAIKASQLRWQFALEGSKDGVWDWNLVNKEIYYSPQWKSMLGYDNNEIDNNLDVWTSRIHPDDSAKCMEDLNKHIEGTTDSYRNIHRLLSKDGTYKWILDRGMVTERDSDGKPIRMIGTHTDLTERMEMENKLRRLNADKNQFIRILGHDLRSPFNALIGYSNLLSSNLYKNDMQQTEKFIQVIAQTAQNTYALLDQILLWTKSQSGELTINVEKFDFALTISEVLKTIEHDASRKSIQINIMLEEEMTITADLNMFKTIMRNLVTNAIKFTRKGGFINISAEKDAHNLFVTVADNGIGMEKDALSRLWSSASDYTTSGTDDESGTGFGLKLCKDLVEMHNGRIWVESVVEKGSDFKFTIPLK